jgi:hypothetical protein
VNPVEQVAQVVKECLERGAEVEIDGLGRFRRGRDGAITFVEQQRTRVFLAYVIEDREAAGRLYDGLARRGFDPWMDCRKLLPGQNWPRAIERAIAGADFFLGCFSPRSTIKRGQFQAELRYALDCADRVPLDQIYFIPVRLEECGMPSRIRERYHWVDLFPEWERGVDRLAASMRRRISGARLSLGSSSRNLA